MEGALAWIGQVVEWIGRWIPRLTILNTTFGGVCYTGHWRKEMTVTAHGPGLLVWWPLRTELATYPIVRQTDDLRTQTFATSDDKTVAAAGLVTYELSDILLLLPRTFEPQKLIREVSLTAIHDVCCRMSWDELKDEQRRGTLETKLRNAARRQLEEYGVRVLRVQLTDLAPARVLKVIQTTGPDES